MIDREKVIKGLECCADLQRDTMHRACDVCPYNDDPRQGTCVTLFPLFRDALVLLKAEKKTKVVFKQYDGSIESECGNCGLYLDKAYSRCPKCNKELDWNGG